MIECIRMKLNLQQFRNQPRLLIAVFVLSALVLGNFCFTPSTAQAHGGDMEVMVELAPLSGQADEDCCHGTFHNENHEPAKIAVGNQQINNQAGIVSASTTLYFSNLSSGNIGYFEYSKNAEEDANPPNSILLC